MCSRRTHDIAAAVDEVDRALRSPARPGARTHSPTTRRPSGRTVSICSTRVPASDGPNASMILATIWRDSHSPHACSGGTSAVIGRNVNALTRPHRVTAATPGPERRPSCERSQ